MSKIEHNGIYYDPNNEIVCDKKTINNLIVENEHYKKKIADLEAKLAEQYTEVEKVETHYLKQREHYTKEFNEIIDNLKQQLAEKEKEIDKLEDKLQHYYEETLNQGTCGLCEHLRGEYKTDFAIAQLEKVKELCIKDMTICEDYFAIENILDQQIKELKEKTNVKD